MRAAVVHGPGQLAVETLDDPEPGPGEVVLAVRAATTCATDVKMLERGHRALGPYPARFGHEFAGEILACGPGVDRWQPGDRVFCADSAPCGGCPSCLAGREANCADLLFLLGGFGQHLLVPDRVVARNLHPLPPAVPLARAPAAEPLACVVRAVDGAGVAAGDVAVVVGAGSIGLLLCAVLSLGGAAVVAVDPHADRLALARAMGASTTVTARRTAADADAVREATGGQGGAHVFEAVGRPAAWELAVAMAAVGGTVTFVGGCAHGTTVTVPTARIHYDEVTLRGSFHHTPVHIARALALLGDDAVPWDTLVGPAITLDDLVPLLTGGRVSCTGHAKQLVDPWI